MRKIKFGTDGWRSVMAENFTFDNVKLVAQAIASFLQDHPLKDNGVVIAYDNRFLSEHFAAEVGKIMAGNGIKSYIANRATPTPVAAYAITTHNAAGAIMITASHNPPEYNGIKFIPEYAGPALPDITNKIEDELSKVMDEGLVYEMALNTAKSENLYEEFDPMPEYKKHLKQLINLDAICKANLRIVVDPMFGAGINYLDQILEEEGCSVITINNYRDPLFGGSIPEPSARVLTKLKSRVLSEGADLGLALDGDADRFGVIDSNGDYIIPNKVLYMLYYHLLNVRKCRGPVARSVATTHMLDRMAEKFGYQAEETPVGFKFIGESMRKRGSILGGEESGGLSIQGHIPEKDGILATLLMAEIRAIHGKTLTGVIKQITDEFGTVVSERMDVCVDPKEKDRIMEELRAFDPAVFNGRQVTKRISLDGTKVILDDGSWVLIRASGTEPLFRIYVEANSEQQMREMQKEVRAFFKM
ncbi:phosphoglucomutase/phosphomannomutase family protein [Candidatus Formimonas warabiya]|uniref:Phosphoglucomutase n=1 Tax=Formimonas warabiya TaxID=1761012 RepID=A0A3G1KU41_FORW1|nr:phosphoglucomutase/phosphomannomutase family protein [Candidatus Formimonas warabiya]ATW25937.1 phosphoglucomutase [Candidatus Formimonas warabiya]